MKKLFLSLAFAITMCIAANAQVWVGGSLNFWSNTVNDADIFSFRVAPEAGYCFNDKWCAALYLGFQNESNNDVKQSAFFFNPYARYTYCHFGPVSFYLDGGFTLGVYNAPDDENYTFSEFGIKPGLAINCNEHICIACRYGFLGYRTSEISEYDTESLGQNGFGLDLSGYNLSFGVFYNF